jgi:hypothetical protein
VVDRRAHIRPRMPDPTPYLFHYRHVGPRILRGPGFGGQGKRERRVGERFSAPDGKTILVN